MTDILAVVHLRTSFEFIGQLNDRSLIHTVTVTQFLHTIYMLPVFFRHDVGLELCEVFVIVTSLY